VVGIDASFVFIVHIWRIVQTPIDSYSLPWRKERPPRLQLVRLELLLVLTVFVLQASMGYRLLRLPIQGLMTVCITIWCVYAVRELLHLQHLDQPNLLGFLLLVPPNFNLVASLTVLIFGLRSLPSVPNSALVTASLPIPNPRSTTSRF
jgi:hypothetical protein